MSPAEPPASDVIPVWYLGRSSVILWGRVTGRRYECSPARPQSEVDARDAVALLASGLFRRA